ncbi:hypothetical protein APA_2775 [Pseudanabaena sp. lw0831]|nr:hypothetical protein APA_2775 [Pseudanabaena sp. lw0831]
MDALDLITILPYKYGKIVIKSKELYCDQSFTKQSFDRNKAL